MDYRSGLTSAIYCTDEARDDSSLCNTHNFSPLNIADFETMRQKYASLRTLEQIPIDSTFKDVEHFMQTFKVRDTKFICSIITTPTCKEPKKVTGLGDNISSTGFIYQDKRKHQIGGTDDYDGKKCDL